MAYERYDVVKVPFPFTDRQPSKTRPALVLSQAARFNQVIGHGVLAMITSAGHAAWPLDTPITDLAAAGLPAPSIARMKLFTFDVRLILAPLGRLAGPDRASVERAVGQLLGLVP